MARERAYQGDFVLVSVHCPVGFFRASSIVSRGHCQSDLRYEFTIATMRMRFLNAVFLALSTRITQVVAQLAPVNLTLRGHINPDQVYSFVYVSFEVPVAATSIYVLQNYTGRGQGNAVDLGVFDPRGYEIADGHNGTSGFRGWSGGFRNNFTITPENATPAYIAGPIWPGEWNVVLGPYTSVPAGIDYELNVTIGFDPVPSYFEPAFSSDRIEQELDEDFDADTGAWYRGDLHLHTSHSDGRYSPEEIVDYAQRRELDFFFSTDHNTQSSNLIWGAVQPPGMLIGRGEEVTTRHGHWNAFGLNWWQWSDFRYHPGDEPGLEEAKRQVREAGGLVSINHPFALCGACNWTFSYDDWDAIEVWNGPWDQTDELAVSKWQQMLSDGYYITAIGGSDAHRDPDVVGLPTTVVRARTLATADILDGLRRRRAYLVRDPEMEINFYISARGGWPGYRGSGQTQVGDRIEARRGARAVLSARGLDGAKASFISQRGIMYQEDISGSREMEFRFSDADWLRVEVRNGTGSMLGMTNPILLS